MAADFPSVVELNVGGVFYSTALSTLTKEADSLLADMFSGKPGSGAGLVKDQKGKYFLDRDGVLFRYVLDYIRNGKLVLPENFHEKERLKQEAEHFRLPAMARSIDRAAGHKPLQPGPTPAPHLPPIVNSTSSPVASSEIPEGDSGYIVVGYRGTFAFGRDGLADVKFRKLSRILVSGRVSLCREVFRDTLNESRDPDRGTDDRYTARYFLKHTFLEQAFDMLGDSGFRMVGSCASATNSSGEIKPGMDSEENKWNHYNEFVFARP
jgi:hypothetical protein